MTEGTDLFGEVPVTWPEVFAWVHEVAGIEPDSPRALGYVRAWGLPAKVARAKLDGWRPREEKPRAAWPGETPFMEID